MDLGYEPFQNFTKKRHLELTKYAYEAILCNTSDKSTSCPIALDAIKTLKIYFTLKAVLPKL